jgi:hypothetical protein
MNCKKCESENLKLINMDEEFFYKNHKITIPVQYYECQECQDTILVNEQDWFRRIKEFKQLIDRNLNE